MCRGAVSSGECVDAVGGEDYAELAGLNWEAGMFGINGK